MNTPKAHREQTMPEKAPTSGADKKPARKAAPKRAASSASQQVKKSTPKSSAGASTTSQKGAPKMRASRAAGKAPSARATRSTGASATTSRKAPQSGPGNDHVRQAENVLDETGQKVGQFLARVTTRMRRAAALAAEEIEDMWAEAQSIRRGQTKG